MADTNASYPELKITVQDSGKVVATPLSGNSAEDGQIDKDALLLETLKSIRNWLNQGQLNIKCEAELIPVGKLLHRLLFERGGNNVRDLIQKRLSQARFDEKPICIQLEFQPGMSELASLPWEFLYSPEVGCFWAFISSLVLTRFTKLSHRDREPLSAEDLPLRMLIIVSRKGGGTIGANESIEAIKKFADANSDRIVLVDTLEDMSFIPLKARLKELAQEGKRPHFVHYIGHGRFNKTTSQGEAALPNAEGTDAQWLNHEQFSRLFCDSGCIPRLVFLQICDSGRVERGAFVETFEGLGPSLIKMNVQVVVAMQFRIPIECATRMCKDFYDELTRGRSVGQAVQTARLNTVIDDPVAAGTPVLYMYGYDGAIVSVARTPSLTPGGRSLGRPYIATEGSSTNKPESGPPEGTWRAAPRPASSPLAGGELSAALNEVVMAGNDKIRDMKQKGEISEDQVMVLNRELFYRIRPALRGKTGYEMAEAIADRVEKETDICLKYVLDEMFNVAGKMS